MKYYGVTRSTDHLAHYGVKGMRWGVRRAIATGNERQLYKHYRKAAKKLAKLQRIGDHAGRSKAKAIAYGTAAAGTGALAIGGTDLAAKGIRGVQKGTRLVGLGLEKLGVNTTLGTGKKLSQRELKKLTQAADSIEKWGKGSSKLPVGIRYGTVGRNGQIEQIMGARDLPVPIGLKKKAISNNTIFRVGAGAATAALAAKAAQNAYRARNAEKYRDKAERFKEAMDQEFAGTQYEGNYTKRIPRRRRRRGDYS